MYSIRRFSSVTQQATYYQHNTNRLCSWLPNTEKRSYNMSKQRRKFSDDKCLNSVILHKVNTLPDRAITLEKRVLINLFSAEVKRNPSSVYFEFVQTELEPFHRVQAIDWLFDVCKTMKCKPDILPLATNIFDRYLSNQKVSPQDIQAIAGVCLMLASKLKEPTPINAKNLNYFSSGAIDDAHVLSYEILILHALDWDVAAPTAFDFYDQVVSRLPRVSVLRTNFISLIHGFLRDYKIATFLPSIQCGIALLSAAKSYNATLFREISGLSTAPLLSVPTLLGVDTKKLHEILLFAENIQGINDWIPEIDMSPRVYQVVFHP